MKDLQDDLRVIADKLVEDGGRPFWAKELRAAADRIDLLEGACRHAKALHDGAFARIDLLEGLLRETLDGPVIGGCDPTEEEIDLATRIRAALEGKT